MGDSEWVERFKHDYRQLDLPAEERAMLDYVRQVTLRPGATERADVERLRDAGFGDGAILEINQITGFFAWCNRTVSGLGVELEAFWEQGLSHR